MRSFHQWVGGAIFATVGFAVSAAAASADVAACEPSAVATNYPALAGKTIKIGQDGESRPFSFRDPADFNHIVGLDADTARAVFACVGVSVEFVTGSWSGLIPATMAGQIDVMWDTLLYTPERAKRLAFVSYMNAATGMIVAKGNPRHLTSLEDLCGSRATAALGTTQEAMLRETSAKCVSAGKKPLDIITSADIPSGMRLVQSGRADILATNKFLGDAMVASNSDTLENGLSVKTGARIGVGTAKGNSDLVRAMADSLRILEANGQLKAIFEKYHVDYELVTAPEILTQ